MIPLCSSKTITFGFQPDFGFVTDTKLMIVSRSPVFPMRGGTVENDRAAAGFAGDGIGFEPLAVAHVTAEHPLIGQQADFSINERSTVRLPS